MSIKKINVALTVALATTFCLPATEEQVEQENTKKITVQEQSIIANILSQVATSAIQAIADEIQATNTHMITLDQAQALLTNQAKNLVIGSTFELNDIHYTVQDYKTMDIVAADTPIDEESASIKM